MISFLHRRLPLLLLAGTLLTVCAALFFRPQPALPISPKLSALATPPDWTALEIYQNTITRSEFERLLTTVFTTGDAWKSFLELSETEARIHTGDRPPHGIFTLRFASAGSPPPRQWRTAAELPACDPTLPLSDLKIAIDAGHIGGAWAKMEERWFVFSGGTPVQEGDMTLYVAKQLKPQLEALGARVTLVRETLEPLTPLRPETLLTSVHGPTSTESPQKLAERLFYRTAEIHARAKLVNETLKPDLVLCLHFNAEGWGDPTSPTLIPRTHLHLLLNGAYTDEEIQLADQRYALLEKLLQRTHQEEALVGAAVADVFAKISGLPPYLYPPLSKSVRPVAGHPYLWARNLLANRLYHCPVIFMEPYVMNSTIDYPRIQAGDYPSLREVNGKLQPSIFQEYATALTEALKLHYQTSRKRSHR